MMKTILLALSEPRAAILEISEATGTIFLTRSYRYDSTFRNHEDFLLYISWITAKKLAKTGFRKVEHFNMSDSGNRTRGPRHVRFYVVSKVA